MDPLVSILIPAFNAERWLADTIRSAMAQTWRRKEIIVVDDGSRDGTLEIARRFVDQGVQVIAQQNQGAAAARNAAFSHCHGDYIQWLDADDLLAEDKITQQMQAMAQRPCKRTLFSCSWGYFFHRPAKALFDPTPLWCDLSPVEWLVRKLDQNLFMQPATWLVSRELTEASGPWDVRLSLDDDGEYFCRVLLASDGIRFVPDARVFYRRSGADSMSSVGRSAKKLESQFLSMVLHIRYLRALEDSARVHEACLRYLQRWLIYFYPERLDLARLLEGEAGNLGGHLDEPELPWKYAWIQHFFGWGPAKRAWVCLPNLSASICRGWDKALSRLEKPGLRGQRG